MAEAKLTARVETKGVKKASQELDALTKRTNDAEAAVTDAANAFLKAEKRTKQLGIELGKATKKEKLAAAAALRLAKEEEDVAKATFKAKKQQLTYAKSLQKSAQESDDLTESTKRNNKSFGDSLRTVRNLTAGVAAAGVGFAALAVRQADVEKNLGVLAFLAEETTDEFKALTFATEQVGISGEKFADIAKDVNDKLADFVSTGGGEAKDIFETLGDQIGFTAQELQQMSGADTLQALKNSFDEANVPMAQQVFLFESLANDSAKLIPLLAENGIQLENLKKQFKDVNEQIALNAAERKNLDELSKSFDLLGSTSSNALTKISAVVAPKLNEIFGGATLLVSDATVAFSELFRVFQDVTAITDLTALQNEYNRAVQFGTEQQRHQSLAIIEGRVEDAKRAGQFIELSQKRINEVQKQINKINDLNAAEAKAAEERRIREEAAAKEQERLRKEREAKIAADLAQKKKDAEDAARLGQATVFFDQTEKLGKSQGELVNIEEEERLAKLETFRTNELESLFDFEEAKNAIIADAEAKRQAMTDEAFAQQLAAGEQGFGALADLIGQSQGKQSAAYKAMFAVQKAFTLASAINSLIKAQTDAGATGLSVPEKIANISAITAAMIPLINTLKGNDFNARQQGGQFRAGQNLLVGEQGPELVRFNDGGRIADARSTAGMMAGATPNVTIINQTSGRIDETEVQPQANGDMVIIAREVLNRQVLDPNSEFNKNLDRTRQVKRQF